MISYDPLEIAAGRDPFDFHEFASFNGAAFAVYRGTGVETSPWEIHRDTDEWLMLLRGSVTIEILTDTNRHLIPLVAGQFTIVPQGRWHRHTKVHDVVELYYTPGATDESHADDPRSLTTENTPGRDDT
jgi:mannose-6-phosphate isomerase-like protein (cupin superfamily)